MSLFENLNDSQKLAVEFEGKHALVLAGAGTGKTKTIISRAAYLISQGINPHKIQILSFTRKAAGEIVERVNAMLDGQIAKNLNGSTFHAWCINIIKSNPKVFSFHDFSVIDKEDQVNIFKLISGKDKEILEETRVSPATLSDIYSYVMNTHKSLTETIRKFLYNNKNDDETDRAIQKNKPYIERAIREYIKYKRDHKYLDYDDLLSSVVSALRRNDSARKHIASQYDHILVDEMQDTNPLQWDLLNLFKDDCHLFCVGDDAQSIYAFRGADFKNVHSFKTRVPDSEVLKLEDNYRSTQEILDISNWLLSQSDLNYNKRLRAVRGNGNKPIIINFYNDWEEANWIGDDIINRKVNESKSYSDHLILSRSVRGLRIIEAIFIEKKYHIGYLVEHNYSSQDILEMLWQP